MGDKRISIDNWNQSAQFEVALHPHKSNVIVINYPEISGDIDGYNNKYAQLADFIRENDVGAVVRSGNQEFADYPNGMVGNFRSLIEYSIKNSMDIAECKDPKIYLMGFSAGASTITAIAADYPSVEKILLMAPSGDAENACENLSKFSGEVYIAVGDNDEIVGEKAGKIFYDMAISASKRELEIIPNCNHQFTGETNGKIMSLAPLWAFGNNKTFPSPEDGKILYK